MNRIPRGRCTDLLRRLYRHEVHVGVRAQLLSRRPLAAPATQGAALFCIAAGSNAGDFPVIAKAQCMRAALSARVSSVGGTSRPSAFAVFRLMTSAIWSVPYDGPLSPVMSQRRIVILTPP